MPKLSENSEIALPIRNIISMIAAAVVAAWAYFGIVERLNRLESLTQMHSVSIESNTDWVNGFKPPEAVQDSVKRVRAMELKMKELEIVVRHLGGK
jgi:hypothetical protein|tara:strand:- start:345 stop:632 length:288 start_codon:yes stop_codon:yes gene_type:complete